MFNLNALLSVQAGELLRKPELKSTPAAAAVVTPMRIKLLAPSSPGDVDSSPEARALIPAHLTHPAPLKLLPPATHHARFATMPNALQLLNNNATTVNSSSATAGAAAIGASPNKHHADAAQVRTATDRLRAIKVCLFVHPYFLLQF